MSKEVEEKTLHEVIYKPTIDDGASEALKPGPTPTKLFPYIAAATVSLVPFAIGIAFGWTSPVLPKLQDPDNNPLGRVPSAFEESWIVGCLSLGAVFGSLIAGPMVNRMGRKLSILIIACPMAASLVVLAFAQTVSLYCAMRFVFGVGIGSSFTIVPMYLGEIAEDHNRGTIGCFVGIFVTSGLLFAYAVGPYVTIKHFCLLSAIPFLIFFAVFTMWIPESPQFLAMSHNRSGLEASLMKFRKKSPEEVRKEADAILKSVEEESKNQGKATDLVSSRGLRKGLVISVGLVTLQQFAGINAVLCYMQTIFDAAGGGLAPELATIFIGVVQVFANILTSSIVDRLGRKILLLASLLGSCVSLISLGAYFYLKSQKYNVDPIFWLPVSSLLVYIVAFSIGLGPLPWAIMAELFPSNIKSAAMTLSNFVCFFGAFVIMKCFPLLVSVLQEAFSFWVFALVCVAGMIFVYCVLPETKGKSLQEIQRLLER